MIFSQTMEHINNPFRNWSYITKITSVLVIGVSISLFLLYIGHNLEIHKISKAFDRAASERSSLITKTISNDIAILNPIASLYRVTDDVTLDKFRTFVNPILQEHSSMQAIEWIPSITKSNRDYYENEMQKHFMYQRALSEQSHQRTL